MVISFKTQIEFKARKLTTVSQFTIKNALSIGLSLMVRGSLRPCVESLSARCKLYERQIKREKLRTENTLFDEHCTEKCCKIQSVRMLFIIFWCKRASVLRLSITYIHEIFRVIHFGIYFFFTAPWLCRRANFHFAQSFLFQSVAERLQQKCMVCKRM